MLKKIKNKIIFLTVASIFFLGLILIFLQIYNLKKLAYSDLDTLEQTLKNDYDKNIKEQVLNVITIIDHFNELYKEGVYTKEQAKEISADVVRHIRYGSKDKYFWIDTKEGINIVLPDSTMNGKNRYDFKDKRDNYFIRNIITNAQNPDGGYTNYWYNRAGDTTQLPKRFILSITKLLIG